VDTTPVSTGAAPVLKAVLDRKGKAPLPDQLSPQLASLASRPPSSSGWLYEVKYDGYRMLCRIQDRDVRFLSRSDNDWTARMASLAKAVGELSRGTGWLDGEVVCFDSDGVSSFQALQQALDGRAENLVFVAFDVLFWNGHDVRSRTLVERQALLEAVLEE